MTSSRADTQEPSVHIMATDHAVRARSSALSCIIGQDIVILPDVLGKYCVRELTARVDDLVVLAGVVAFADRAVQRKAASAWSRALHLTLPVHDRAFWERPESVTALTQTLDALTGDKWSFAFRPRTKQTPVNPQATLALSGQQRDQLGPINQKCPPSLIPAEAAYQVDGAAPAQTEQALADGTVHYRHIQRR